MKKVAPLNQYVCRENSRNDSNESNDSSNSSDSNYTSDGYKASTYIVNIKK